MREPFEDDLDVSDVEVDSEYLPLVWPFRIGEGPGVHSVLPQLKRSATIFGAACRALSICDWSLPPASAISDLPPPEPPTSLATAPTSLPAGMRLDNSGVTPAMMATLPSGCADASTTTPSPSLPFRLSTNVRSCPR